MIIYSVPLLAISLLLIVLISDRIIRYVLVISKALGLSQMAAGFILLSIITSLPELSVSIVSSIAGEGGLSVGNILGSNIANLTIILGLAILLSRKDILIRDNLKKNLYNSFSLHPSFPFL